MWCKMHWSDRRRRREGSVTREGKLTTTLGRWGRCLRKEEARKREGVNRRMDEGRGVTDLRMKEYVDGVGSYIDARSGLEGGRRESHISGYTFSQVRRCVCVCVCVCIYMCVCMRVCLHDIKV